MYAHVHVIMNCNRLPDHRCGPCLASLAMTCICVCAYNVQFPFAHNLKATKLHKVASDVCMVIRSVWNTVSLSTATVTVKYTLVELANIKKKKRCLPGTAQCYLILPKRSHTEGRIQNSFKLETSFVCKSQSDTNAVT